MAWTQMKQKMARKFIPTAPNPSEMTLILWTSLSQAQLAKNRYRYFAQQCANGKWYPHQSICEWGATRSNRLTTLKQLLPSTRSFWNNTPRWLSFGMAFKINATPKHLVPVFNINSKRRSKILSGIRFWNLIAKRIRSEVGFKFWDLKRIW